MVARLAVLDDEGNAVKLSDIENIMDLLTLADQARNLIRDCEQLARDKNPKFRVPHPKVPYMT